MLVTARSWARDQHTMINSLEVYRDAGVKAACAMNYNDGETFRFHASHLRAMLALEQGQHRITARAAYDEAYRAKRREFLRLR